jgi:hypothetical protein
MNCVVNAHTEFVLCVIAQHSLSYTCIVYALLLYTRAEVHYPEGQDLNVVTRAEVHHP